MAILVGTRVLCILLGVLLIVTPVQVDRGPHLTLTRAQAVALGAGQSVAADLDGRAAVIFRATRPRLDFAEGATYCVEAKADGRYLVVQCTSWLWNLPLAVLVVAAPDMPRLFARWRRAHLSRATRRG